MKFYLVSTSHLEVSIWFRDDEDFIAGMNYVAVLSLMTGINILAFILMSNHVHFVLECSLEDAKLFIDSFKRLYGAYFHKKYGVWEPLRRNGVDIREVNLAGESLERAIAYVLMNCVAANITATAFAYQWSSASCIFNPAKRSGKPISSFSINAQRRLLRSKKVLPADYLVGEGGYVLPSSYIVSEFVESLYRTPKRLNYFLNSSSKAKLRLEKNAVPSFSDQVIIAAVPNICNSVYRKNTPDSLDSEETKDLLLQIRRRFSADPAQIARVLGKSVAEICRILDGF